MLTVVSLLWSGIVWGQLYVKTRPVAHSTTISVVHKTVPPGRIWIGGNWVVQGNRYVWKEGYYARPVKGKQYVEGYWKRTRKGWKWIPGYWVKAR